VIVPLKYPLAELAICIICLTAYLKPDTGLMADAGNQRISD
jgi:hypothetical protein